MKTENFSKTKIKICGLRRREDILAVNEANPDYCGFIVEFPKSFRSVTADEVRELVKNLSPEIQPVGVFVNAAMELVRSLLDDGTLAMAQLHGQEDESYIAELKAHTDKPVIKAFSIKKADDMENALQSPADYIKSMPETVCFVFVESEVDKRSKMYKAVKDTGRVVELGRQDEKTLLLWLAGNIKREGRQIKQSTAEYMLSRTGTDMENLEREMEKLFSYTLGRNEITVADIDAICTTQITNKIFDMIEAVATRQQRKALDYYYDLLALKEPPMRILYLLARQFRLLLQVKDLMNQGADKSTIAKKAGLHPFVAGKYMQQSRSFTMRELKGIMEEAADTEEAVKTGRLSDTMSVELFIVKYSAPKK